MFKEYEKLFTALKQPEMNPLLFNQVIHSIQKEKKLLIFKKRAIIFSVITFCSILMFLPSFRILQAELTKSGLMQFTSLLFSDFTIITNQWQNFSLSILEALPVLSLIMFLATALLFLESLKLFIRDFKFVLKLK